MTAVSDVAQQYFDARAAADPVYASVAGSQEFDRKLTDYSPDGVARQLELSKRYRASMGAADPTNARDVVTQRVFDERLAIDQLEVESGDGLRRLAIMWSPMQRIREAFDLLPRDTLDQWKVVADRMAEVSTALAGLERSLRQGQQEGHSASRRQALACAAQAAVWAGHGGEGRYFRSLVDEFARRGTGDRKIEDALVKASKAADAAYGEFSRFLSDDYAVRAPEADGVGRERYVRTAQHWLGLHLDVDGAYAWGWDELRRIRRQIAAATQAISPGKTYREVVAELDADHERTMQGTGQLRDWLQALMTRTADQLAGRHFDIPDAVRNIEVRVAPMGTAAASYYLPPSLDLKRPGTFWFPATGRTRFPIWNEISTAYHEGVPGHHLLAGYQRTIAELTPWQRNLSIGGHIEGWSMYAETLMDELGYFDRPEYHLDMLSNSLLRAARLVVDIGLHVGCPIPTEEPELGGQKWSPELAAEFIFQNSAESKAFARSEIDRYLGLPGQALTYKLGEAVWRECRQHAQRKEGAAFDLRAFHTHALGLGPMGLAHLRDTLIPTPS